MSDGKLHIGAGITNEVYVGKIRKLKSGAVVWTSKQNVTAEFWETLIHIMQSPGNEKGLYIGTPSNPKEYEIHLTKTEAAK